MTKGFKAYMPARRGIDAMDITIIVVALIGLGIFLGMVWFSFFYLPTAVAQEVETKNCRTNEECMRLYLEDDRYVKDL